MVAAGDRSTANTVAGALLGTFTGDALGAAYEGAPAVQGEAAGGLAAARQRIARRLADAPLAYTDDTQMCLALAEHCCERPEIDPSRLAEVFLEHYEPWRGYGGGMRALVEQWRRGVPLEQAATAVFPDGSMGNGAAMRVAAVGVRWAHEPQTLEEAARRQAIITHVHPLGVDGAVLQAHAVGLAAVRGRFTAQEVLELRDRARTEDLNAGLGRVLDLLPGPENAPPPLRLAKVAEQLGTAVVAQRSVPAALWAAASASNFPQTITLAVGLGGDADTIAAMAGAIAGAGGGLTAIPRAWLAAMEDGPRGRSYALGLARRLAAVTPPGHAC